MIECPKCGGLNPSTSPICGSCGASLDGINNQNNNQTNQVSNPGLFLYEQEGFETPVKPKDVKNKFAFVSIWHIVLFIITVLAIIFIPIRAVKLGLAFIFFYIAESSNHKNSIFLVLVRIITAIEIWGMIIALILRTFVSIDAMNKFFEYFRF